MMGQQENTSGTMGQRKMDCPAVLSHRQQKENQRIKTQTGQWDNKKALKLKK
jgi:hypothetical protein